MEKRGIFRLNNKKSESLIYPTVIFIILNILFFSILLLFVFKSSSGALIYEQVYAKQIALMIDRAKPDMEISMDFSEGIKIAEKNKLSGERLKKIVEITSEENKVTVSLSHKGGYNFKYFSDYDVGLDFKENKLILDIKEKGAENENTE
tara:strand:+ start:1067 stop:1513 length:447 start_codon:yes stop_codon:yes gene_type:complete